MYVWRNTNRRDRRFHAITNPYVRPSAVDLKEYREWLAKRERQVSGNGRDPPRASCHVYPV